MHHQTKPTAAAHSTRNTTVTTAVLANPSHRCTTVQFYTLLLVAAPSQHKMMSAEHFQPNRPVAVYWKIPLSAATVSHLQYCNCVDGKLLLIVGGNVDRSIVWGFILFCNLTAICIHHIFTLEKCQISYLVSANKRSTVLSPAVGLLLQSRRLSVCIRWDTNTKWQKERINMTVM
jgi:hypothetical protein